VLASLEDASRRPGSLLLAYLEPVQPKSGEGLLQARHTHSELVRQKPCASGILIEAGDPAHDPSEPRTNERTNLKRTNHSRSPYHRSRRGAASQNHRSNREQLPLCPARSGDHSAISQDLISRLGRVVACGRLSSIQSLPRVSAAAAIQPLSPPSTDLALLRGAAIRSTSVPGQPVNGRNDPGNKPRDQGPMGGRQLFRSQLALPAFRAGDAAFFRTQTAPMPVPSPAANASDPGVPALADATAAASLGQFAGSDRAKEERFQVARLALTNSISGSLTAAQPRPFSGPPSPEHTASTIFRDRRCLVRVHAASMRKAPPFPARKRLGSAASPKSASACWILIR